MKKKLIINFEDKNYDVLIKSKDENTIQISLSAEEILKFSADVPLTDIYQKVRAFDGYNLKEIFAVLNDLKNDDFNFMKESDKYIFDIKIKVLKKEKHLKIDLNENKQSGNDIIKELLEKLKQKQERSKKLKEEISELKLEIEKEEAEENKLNEKSNFRVNSSLRNLDLEKLKEHKTLIDYNNSNQISTLTVLADGRIALGEKLLESAKDRKYPTGIHIFSGENFSELIFMEDIGPEFIELKKDHLLAKEGTLNLLIIKLNDRSFDKLKTISTTNELCGPMVQLANGNLAFVENTKISIYKKESDEYNLDHQIPLPPKYNSRILAELNLNEIIYDIRKYFNEDKQYSVYIKFYDTVNKTIKKDLYLDEGDINIAKKISKDYFAISCINSLSLIDNKSGKRVNIFQTSDVNYIFNCLCFINPNLYLISYKNEIGESRIVKSYLDTNSVLRSEQFIDNVYGGISKMDVLKNGKLIYVNSKGNALIVLTN